MSGGLHRKRGCFHHTRIDTPDTLKMQQPEPFNLNAFQGATFNYHLTLHGRQNEKLESSKQVACGVRGGEGSTGVACMPPMSEAGPCMRGDTLTCRVLSQAAP
jgi:hypothetical protein